MRTKLIVGNWKMNKSIDESIAFTKKFNQILNDNKGIIKMDLVVAMPSLSLGYIAKKKLAQFSLAAQNMFWEKNGAYTGEISSQMLNDLNIKYVILGHSERRMYLSETDAMIAKKTLAAIQANIVPIICVGETEEEYDDKRTFEIVKIQVLKAIKNVTNVDLKNIIIAYEPIWAIGSGKSATPEIAQAVAVYIRKIINENFSPIYGNEVRILYGGSVNNKNIISYISTKDIDGALVGGASLDPDSFASLLSAEEANTF